MKRAPDTAIKAPLASIAGIPKACLNQDFNRHEPETCRIIVRADTEDDTVDATSERIAALFSIGFTVTSGNTITQIMQPPHVREGIIDGTDWRVPVTVRFETSLLPRQRAGQ